MSLRYDFIALKDKLSEKDEQYVVSLIKKGKLNVSDVFHKLNNPTPAILEALYTECKTKDEKTFLLFCTPPKQIRDIKNIDYLEDLITYNFRNFENINFEEIRNNDIYAYAKLLQTYGKSLSETIYYLNTIGYSGLKENELTTLNICQEQLESLREDFDEANALLKERKLQQEMQNKEEDGDQPNA